ncbi:MAG: response regulator transcription factor [Cyanobacteria bacterium SZAS LIN-5]|nr:response regulator transcription factor [Cyanobacteria bacterium SZAS LIN-5]
MFSLGTNAGIGLTIDTGKSASILLVEDDVDIALVMESWLRSQRYSVKVAKSGEEALQILQDSRFDILILDWMLPGLSGLQVCQHARREGDNCLIIMLTNKAHVAEKEIALDAGADDYLTKPFNLRELSARLRALLRRPKLFRGFTYQIKDLILDCSKFTVQKGGVDVPLLPREFALLEFLMRNADVVFSPEEILNNVWASEAQASPDTIRTYIKKLRRKLDTPGRLSMFRTVHSVGYCLDSDNV